MYELEVYEKELVSSAFNMGGYVLDFSDERFSEFTKNVVGIDLLEVYGLSKAKSLRKFIYNGDTQLVMKLLEALIYYCEGFDSEKYISVDTIKKVKNIIRKYEKINNISIRITELKKFFGDSNTEKQIDQMLFSIKKNPSDAIGKSKDLIESCLKTILIEREICDEKEINKKDISELIKLVKKELGLSSYHESIKKIIGSLSGLASGLYELRNSKGHGHGKIINKFQEPSEVEAMLAVDACLALVNFFWALHKNKKY